MYYIRPTATHIHRLYADYDHAARLTTVGLLVGRSRICLGLV